MKKITAFVLLVSGILIGAVLTGLLVNFSASRMMIKEIISPYGYDKTSETLISRINSKPGWHVVSVIDQDKEVLKYGGEKIGKVRIIQYCSGKWSSKVLADDNRMKIAIFMPKTFAVYEKTDGRTFIALSNGAVIGKIFDAKTADILEKVSLEVEDILQFANFKFSLF